VWYFSSNVLGNAITEVGGSGPAITALGSLDLKQQIQLQIQIQITELH
jgi:hypothetical protein